MNSRVLISSEEHVPNISFKIPASLPRSTKTIRNIKVGRKIFTYTET